MATLTVRVAPGLRAWAAGDHDVRLEAPGEHELEDPSPELAAAVAAAVAAGSLELVDGKVPKDAVEDDAVSLKLRDRAEKAVFESGLHEQRDAELHAAPPEEHDAIVERYDELMHEVREGA